MSHQVSRADVIVAPCALHSLRCLFKDPQKMYPSIVCEAVIREKVGEDDEAAGAGCGRCGHATHTSAALSFHSSGGTVVNICLYFPPSHQSHFAGRYTGPTTLIDYRLILIIIIIIIFAGQLLNHAAKMICFLLSVSAAAATGQIISMRRVQ